MKGTRLNHRRTRTGRACEAMAAAAGALACVTLAAADVHTRTVVLSGQPASPTHEFSFFADESINSRGQVVFWSRLVSDASVNDNCGGAITLTEGAHFVSNQGATDGAATGCAWVRDVWFRWVAPDATPRTVALTAGAEFRAQVEVMRTDAGDCTAPFIFLGCSQQSVSFQPEAGRAYFIRLGSLSGSPLLTGSVVLQIRRQFGPPQPVILVDATNDGSVWSDRDGSLALVLQEGATTAFDAAAVHGSVQFPAMNDDGLIGLTGSVVTTSPTQTTEAALFTIDLPPSNDNTLLFRETQPPAPPPPAPRTNWVLPIASLNDSGRIGYALTSGTELRAGAATVLRGQAAPGTSGPTFLFLDQPTLCPFGAAFVFRSTIEGTGVTASNNSGLWADRGKGVGLALVARTGDAAPGAGGAAFAALGIAPSINQSGRTVFWGSLPGAAPGTGTGIWTDRGGPLAPLALAGQPAPHAAGAAFRSFSARPTINTTGAIAFRAELSGAPSTPSDNSGLWVYKPDGSARLAVREGAQVPGEPADVFFASLSEPVLNSRAQLAFTANLRGVGTTMNDNTGLFVSWPAGAITTIMRTGDTFEVGPSDSRTVREIGFGAERAGTGRASFTDDGTLVYRLIFTDGTSGIFVTSVSCPADYDNDGQTGSSDLFAFLQLFFQNDPAADFNDSGTVSVQDLFDFLAAWFRGCA